MGSKARGVGCRVARRRSVGDGRACCTQGMSGLAMPHVLVLGFGVLAAFNKLESSQSTQRLMCTTMDRRLATIPHREGRETFLSFATSDLQCLELCGTAGHARSKQGSPASGQQRV